MATLLQDTFTDTNATNLSAHTMNTGPGWSYVEGSSWFIVSNMADDAADSPGTILADASATDATASVDVQFGTGFGSSDQVALVFRAADANNYWLALLLGDGTFDLYEKTASTFNLRGTSSFGALAANTAYTLQAVLAGASVTITINGGHSLSFTMGTGLAATKFGLRCSCATGAHMRADNFLVSTGGATFMPPLPFVHNQAVRRSNYY